MNQTTIKIIDKPCGSGKTTITIYGSKASTKVFSWLFHWAKKGMKKKVAIKGATHVDLYDQDVHVDKVITASSNYFA